jgi:hypothetical protein
MDRQYPDYPQYDHRRPWTYHSAAPTTPMTSMYSSMYSSMPERPQPTASAPSRRPPMRRHSERRSGPRAEEPRAASTKRSLPHNGTTCSNSLCDSPAIAPDERLCPGPKGVDLCSRCYKRFKVERRHAMEDRRAVTDDWKTPRRRRSSPQPTAAPSEPPLASEAGFTNTHVGDRSQVEPTVVNPSIFASRFDESARQPSPLITPPLPLAEKESAVHDVSSVDVESQVPRDPRPPQNQRSQRGRNDRQERRSHARDLDTYDEAEYYKYGRMDEDDAHNDRRGCCGFWSGRRKCVVFSIILSVILLIIIIALAVTLPRRGGFKYTPSIAQVNNTVAFDEGGATRKSVNDTSVGIGAGTDSYTYYQGNASTFPPKEKWVSFTDMWDANLDTFKHSCGWLDRGADNTPEIIQDIYNAIQDRANASLVDHRIILATIIQETNGCPLVSHTTSSGGTRNPGLMQSHNGHQYDAKHSRLSIMLMVQDGTQGTDEGWGLVQNLNTYGNPYKAMRGYNSGYIPTSGDLSEKAGATACYVSDMANRLTGWVRAKTTCPGDAN